MAINKITAPLSTGPSVFADPVINQLAALLTDCNHGTRVSGGYVKQGSLWNIGGAMFMANSDTAITGTRSASTTGVKFTVSGNTATVSYGADSVTWDGSQQGFYDSNNNFYYCGDVITGNHNIFIANATINNTSYTKLLEYQVRHGGIYRIFTSIDEEFFTVTYYVRVYINDIAVGTVLASSSTFQSLTEDLFIEDRDKISLYGYKTGGDVGQRCDIEIKNGEEGRIT